MEGMNKVLLVGRLGQNPELIQNRSGRPYTRLNLATERRWKDRNGQLESRTAWHRVMVWGRTAEICSQYLKRGAPVMVEGFLNYYEIPVENGETRRVTSVTAEKVNFLPFSKRGGEGSSENYGTAPEPSAPLSEDPTEENDGKFSSDASEDDESFDS